MSNDTPHADSDGPLPSHAGAGVDAIAQIHAQYEDRASRFQRGVESLRRSAATPAFCALIAVCLIVWVVWHVVWSLGGPVADPAPYHWIEGIGTWTALFMTVLILVTQRRENEFAEARERLMLELALLSEQKSAKIIELVERLRRDHPQIDDHVDPEAHDMARPIDPQTLFAAVDPGSGPSAGNDQP